MLHVIGSALILGQDADVLFGVHMCCSVLNRLASQVSVQISGGVRVSIGLAITDWLVYPIVQIIITRIPLYNKVAGKKLATVTGLAGHGAMAVPLPGGWHGVGMPLACR